MAKSSNPIDVYRRQQRKKQVQKNKSKRISARDTKVAETASLDEVKGEIKKLERKQENHNGHLDNKETRKLERLQKELKIVIAAEEDRKKAAVERAKQEWEDKKKRLKTREGVIELNQAKFKHAKASIYYDPVMNPFGAPPPGLAMIFHRRGGGRTMNPEEAFVPYELRDDSDAKSDADDGVINDAVIKSTISNEGNRKLANVNNAGHEHGIQVSNTMASVPPPPPPPPSGHKGEFYQKRAGVPPPPTRRARLPPPQSQSRSHQKIIEIQEESKKNNSQVRTQSQSGPPALPEPSEAVQRLNKKKSKLASSIMTDIWASTDEIAYDGDTLEGTGMGMCAKQNQNITPRENERAGRGGLKKKRRAEDTERFDPLCPAEEGYSEYRSKDQIERSTKRKKQATLSSELSGTTANETNKKKPCAWYYIDQSGTGQGPFKSEQMIGWKQAGFFPTETMVRDGEEGPFAQVGGVDLATGVTGDQGKTSDAKGIHKEHERSNIDSRIATLKGKKNEEYDQGVEDRIAAIRSRHKESSLMDGGTRTAIADQDEVADMRVQNHISDKNMESIKKSKAHSSMTEVEDSQSSLTSDANFEVSQYPVASKMNEADNSLPENYGVADDDVSVHPYESHESAYHIADAEAYPCGGGSEGDVREEKDAETPYPIDTAYPIEDEYAYPDTNAAYGMIGGGDDEIGSIPYYLPDDTEADDIFTNNCDTKKAVFDGDKAVVGFVPSNLRRTVNPKSKGRKVHKRRIIQKEVTSTSLNGVDSKGVTPSIAISDEYEVFMNEVNALK